jgi:HSP90 family molecular chaperone
VTHSIYTDKEVFLRELVSNASDSLEKYRYLQSTGEIAVKTADPLEININVDLKANTITISDNGIGMTRDELISNLGTIARSGSKAFVEKIKSSGKDMRDGDGIIGQFGVGFYSAYMVADSVSIDSLSATAADAAAGNTWVSRGDGEFEVQPCQGASRGSKIVLSLKDSCKDFADVKKVKEIIKKYSNFVPFPIKVNGETVNTVSAIWVQDKSSVTEEQYTEFYKFISNAFDKPSFTLHFRTDAPINLNALLFVPTFHTEKFGHGRMELGVNLYSRKVLIESKPKDLLPDWMRYLVGQRFILNIDFNL